MGSPCSAPLPNTTPPRGPAGPCPALPPQSILQCLPGQDEAQQHGAGVEQGLEGASELLCGVWLPSSRREAPPEHSGKLLTNVGLACSAGRWPQQRQHGCMLARQGRDPHRWHALALGEDASPQPFGSSLASFQPAPPTKQPPLSCCTLRLSFPMGLGGTPMTGMPGQAELPTGCRGHLGSSWPGRAPHPHRWQLAWHKPMFTPQGPHPAQPAPPVPAHRAPCIAPCPSPETLTPWGHPWASS